MFRFPISKHDLAAACLALFTLAPAVPAHAADGPIVITQAKANAGNVTPGDAPGFPITLSQSGSYKFGSDILVAAGRQGIVIGAYDVTIDLNGFTLNGVLAAFSGIIETPIQFGITIRNGTIFGFKGDAVRGTGALWTIDGVRIWRNGGNGISAGDLLQVRNSALYFNNKNGVVAGNQSTVENSSIVASGINGIVCAGHCLITENVISQNGYLENGVGVSATYGTVLGNMISGNSGFGISGFLTGYGNNRLVSNNNGGVQVSGDQLLLQPNACTPAC